MTTKDFEELYEMTRKANRDNRLDEMIASAVRRSREDITKSGGIEAGTVWVINSN